MNQEKIWDHFQNEGVHSFDQSRSRMKYILGQIKPDKKILNIGVGGAILEYLAIQKGFDIFSLDPSEKAISRIVNELNMKDKAKVGYSENIPFESNTFDVVVMSEVLEHLDDVSFDKSVAEVSRVLTDKGVFIITVPDEEKLADNEVVCPDCGIKFHRWGHKQSFSKHRLRGLIEGKGFEVNRIETRCFPDWRRKGLANLIKSSIRYVLGRIGSNISQPNIYLCAIKK